MIWKTKVQHRRHMSSSQFCPQLADTHYPHLQGKQPVWESVQQLHSASIHCRLPQEAWVMKRKKYRPVFASFLRNQLHWEPQAHKAYWAPCLVLMTQSCIPKNENRKEASKKTDSRQSHHCKATLRRSNRKDTCFSRKPLQCLSHTGVI